VTVADDPFHGVDPLDWPSPSRVRTASGAPGPDYWQQRADYTIAATLDTTEKVVRGTVSIRYTNNSPDTLRFVWLQLDQNLYKPGSKGSLVFPRSRASAFVVSPAATISPASRSTDAAPPARSTIR
jgi:hypothetical protein